MRFRGACSKAGDRASKASWAGSIPAAPAKITTLIVGAALLLPTLALAGGFWRCEKEPVWWPETCERAQSSTVVRDLIQSGNVCESLGGHRWEMGFAWDWATKRFGVIPEGQRKCAVCGRAERRQTECWEVVK